MPNQSKNNDQNQSVELTINQDGLYAIIITATCHKNQDLRIEIDSRVFRELPPAKYTQKFNIPAAFNGAKLKGKTQTNIFILNLEKGKHTLDFITRNNASIIDWKLQKINNPNTVTLNLNLKADNYNCQPILNFVIIDLPVQSIAAKIFVDWHRKSFFRGDGDDVKLVVDNKIIANNHSNWLWKAVANKEHSNFPVENKIVVTNLPYGVHHIEFVADQSPVIRQVVLSLEGSSMIDQVTYPRVFYSDYEVHATTRPYNDNPNKPMLAVYIPSGNPGEINNDNAELYFDDQKLRLGVNAEHKNWESIFDLSSALIQEGHWFLYGIDSSWEWLHSETDWRDDEKWKILKK